MKNVKMEKFKMKKILSLLLAVGLLLALSACTFGSGETVSSAEPEPVESTAAASSTGLDGYRNPLTGEETETDISRNCPVGVMLNNVKEALPQSGNSKADMFYEVPEEGGITRILACSRMSPGWARSALSAAPGPILSGWRWARTPC